MEKVDEDSLESISNNVVSEFALEVRSITKYSKSCIHKYFILF